MRVTVKYKDYWVWSLGIILVIVLVGAYSIPSTIGDGSVLEWVLIIILPFLYIVALSRVDWLLMKRHKRMAVGETEITISGKGDRDKSRGSFATLLLIQTSR